MAKLSIVLVVVCSVFLGISTFAEPVDDSVQAPVQDVNQVDDQDEDTERRGANANANANTNVQSRFRPSPYPPGPYPPPYPNPNYPQVSYSCYTCTNCPNVKQNMTVRYCPPTVNPQRRNKCVVYKEKYNHVRNPYTVRGCASERGSCAEIQAAHTQAGNQVRLLDCNECEGHLCNSGGRSIPSFFIAVLALLVTPLLAKKVLA